MPSDSERRAELGRHYQRFRSSDYRQRWSLKNPGNEAILAEREALLGAAFRRWSPGRPIRALDLGCGAGEYAPDWLPTSPYGVDVLHEHLVAGYRNGNDRLINADGTALPFPNESFDAVILLTVITSIAQPEVRVRFAKEVDRVLAPGGVIVHYDLRFPNPSNPAIRRVSRRKLARLFPGYGVHSQSATVFPPLARRLGRSTRILYPLLSRLPAVRSHVAGVLAKPS